VPNAHDGQSVPRRGPADSADPRLASERADGATGAARRPLALTPNAGPPNLTGHEGAQNGRRARFARWRAALRAPILSCSACFGIERSGAHFARSTFIAVSRCESQWYVSTKSSHSMTLRARSRADAPPLFERMPRSSILVAEAHRGADARRGGGAKATGLRARFIRAYAGPIRVEQAPLADAAGRGVESTATKPRTKFTPVATGLREGFIRVAFGVI